MTINIKVVENRDDWDRLVENSPHATIFHTWNWLKIVEKHTKSKLYPIIGLKGTEPIGVFPLFYQKIHFFKCVFSPPSRAGVLYLGPLIVDYDKLKQSRKESLFIGFQRAINEFIRCEIKANYIRIRSPPDLLDSRPFMWTNYQVEPLYTYLIDLEKGKDHVWKRFKKQLRLDIKKTEREGVSVTEGSEEDLKFLHRSLVRRLEEQGLKANISEAYLLDIYNSFYPQNLKIFIGRYKNENVGGQISICYKDKVSLWIGTPKISVKGVYANDLVQWGVIKWACENGFKQYEIMDSGDDLRLCAFKSKYNPELSPWFSAIKYSSFIFKVFEDIYRVRHKFRLGI